MNALLLTASLALSPVAQQADTQTQRAAEPARLGASTMMPRLGGQWTVVYAEIDGRKMEEKQVASVRVSGNTLTYTHDGKQKSCRLDFGPNQSVRAMDVTGTGAGTDRTGRSDQTQTNQNQSRSDRAQADRPERGSGAGQQGARHGVYIASQEFFCLDLKPGYGATYNQGRTGTTGTRSDASERDRTGTAADRQAADRPAADRQDAARQGAGDARSRMGHIVMILKRSGTGTGTDRTGTSSSSR